MERTLQWEPSGWLGLQCGVDDLSDAFILMGSGAPSAQLIVQALKAQLDKAFNFPTVNELFKCMREAIQELASPWAQARTIWARWTKP